MTHSSFRQRCRTEWQRLHPPSTRANDGVFATLLSACRESVPGYFAPVRFLWWLVVDSWRPTDTGEQR